MATKEVLGEIVGFKNVSDTPEVLEVYSRDESFVRPIKPQCIAKVRSISEVEEIIKWANKSGTPLIPVSSGPPHFRGDTVPSLGGCVIVDLSGMKKIMRIDRRNRVAMVEPGVSFAELQGELAKEGMRLPMPLLPRRTKSVMASCLEREPHSLPKYHWDITDPALCMEVVLGNGETIMTGEAGGLGSLEEQWKVGLVQKWPLGPSQVDFHRVILGAQGTMGIVTWMNLRCELLPQVQKLYFFPSDKVDSLLDFAHQVLKFRYGDELLFLNRADLAYLLGKDKEGIGRLKGSVPLWVLIVNIAGYERFPEDKVKFEESDIKGIAQQFGLTPVSAVSGVRDREVLKVLQETSDGTYWKLRYKGNCQDIMFLTTLKKAPEFIKKMYAVAEGYGYATNEIGMYIQPIMQGVCCHCEFSFPFDPGEKMEVEKVKALVTEGSERLQRLGAYFSRPYGSWADMVYRRDAETTIALRKVKGLFDPNNIMNPGKLCF